VRLIEAPERGPPNSGTAGLDRDKVAYGLLAGIFDIPFKVASPRPILIEAAVLGGLFHFSGSTQGRADRQS
jgi:hypothetical protein